MKKKVVSLLVAAMTVASLTACGNSGSDAPAANQEPAPAEKQEAEPAPAESQAEAPAESQAEAPAPAADGGTISVGFAQVGHESDWRAPLLPEERYPILRTESVLYRCNPVPPR